MSFGRTTFGRNALLLLSAGLAMLVATAVASVWMSLRVRDFAATVAATQQARGTASNTLILLLDAETGQRGYLLTGDAAYLVPYTRAMQALPADLARLHEIVVTDPRLGTAIAALGALAQGEQGQLSEIVALAMAGQHDRALDLMRTGHGKATMDQARDQLRIVLARLDARLARATADVRGSGRALLGVQLAGLVLILLLAALGIALVRQAMRELVQAGRAVQEANTRLEARVADRTAELEQANADVQRFATIVSHDLRAPLVNIVGFTAELQAGLDTLRPVLAAVEAARPGSAGDAARTAITQDMPEAIGFIRASTERMDRLINAILRLSREGSRSLAAERIDMQDLFERLAESVRHQLDEANATLTVGRDMPAIVSDRLALEQIFGNLIDNAVKYLDPSRPGRIEVRGHRRFSRLVYEIADNGRGIAPADRARVFELFRRAGAPDRPGEGIGLAHVRATLRRLGGSVECESEPGVGSVFRVLLPAAPRGEGSA